MAGLCATMGDGGWGEVGEVFCGRFRSVYFLILKCLCGWVRSDQGFPSFLPIRPPGVSQARQSGTSKPDSYCKNGVLTKYRTLDP